MAINNRIKAGKRVHKISIVVPCVTLEKGVRVNFQIESIKLFLFEIKAKSSIIS
jgi:hypothetical protein